MLKKSKLKPDILTKLSDQKTITLFCGREDKTNWFCFVLEGSWLLLYNVRNCMIVLPSILYEYPLLNNDDIGQTHLQKYLRTTSSCMDW